ncbi:hypothetical protein MYX77_03300 [Acidobacteriia bacterium AH_259_A11_L15]|nr:hypothetical protein [Acidobacteriia bacterium AH_259_A11_L15]
MGLLDVLLGGAEREKKTFPPTSSPSPPSSPVLGSHGDEGDEGDDIQEIVFNSGRDPYAERMQAALRAICRPNYPEGMALWLKTAHPELYAELMEYLPDEINRLWDARAPLAEFDAVLARMVKTHQRGCTLYREFLAARNRNQEEAGE